MKKDIQLIAAEVICHGQTLSNDLYNWAKQNGIDLVANGHILSRPENFRILLSDVLNNETFSTKLLIK